MTFSIQETSLSAWLLSLWAEVGRHRELEASAPVLGLELAAALPFEALWVDELSADAKDLIRMLEWTPQSRVPSAPSPRRNLPHAYPASVMRQVQRWAEHGELARCIPGGRWSSPFMAVDGYPPNVSGLVGPLVLDGLLIGLLTVLGPAGRAYTQADEQKFAAALAPLAAATANDLRIREMQRLGAAAEADRQSLLSRLGRNTLSEVVVGADQGLRQVMQRVAQVAKTDASVLILGETGAGKEVVARSIHQLSRRRQAPFVRVNCGAVPPDLIDSELFGHEKGSFTGAMAVRRGWFERADGGTLFLDEIGELTPAVQIRLLRVLQDGVVQRVGSEHDLHVDVRVVAATHRDLPNFVQEGRFREDLWYRLAVFPIILPPLRERPEDMPMLANHFVQRAANRLGVPVPPLTNDDIRRLQAYRWPGNVRELSSVLERAVILGHGTYLDLATALGEHPGTAGATSESAVSQPPPRVNADAQLQSLDAVMEAHLKHVLRLTMGRIDGPDGAARRLQVNASTLRAKLRKHGIDPRHYKR